MDFVENASVKKASFASTLTKASLLMYLFFIFFGISLPFGERAEHVEDIATSNLVNQLVFTSLYAISFVSLLFKRHKIATFILAEKFFTLFLLWSLLTVFWSESSFVSFKRWVQFFGTGVIILSALMHFQSADDALKYLKIILMTYLPLSVLSILFVPAAIQWEFAAWRGLAPHKNTLGQISLISLIIWSISALDQDSKKKAVAITFWCLSLMFLIGSKSTTCILTGILLFFLVGAFKVQNVIFQPIIGRFTSLAYIFSFLLAMLGIIYFNPDILDSLFSVFGKDMTFTGRIELWESIFSYTKTYFLFGCGFGGFWVVKSLTMEIFYEEYPWLPNQSHLGYLDILNETGLVGLLLFALMIIYYFFNLLKLDKPHPWKWILITVLLLNIVESTLIMPNSVTGVLFLFCYFALYTEHSRMTGSHLSKFYCPSRKL